MNRAALITCLVLGWVVHCLVVLFARLAPVFHDATDRMALRRGRLMLRAEYRSGASSTRCGCATLLCTISAGSGHTVYSVPSGSSEGLREFRHAPDPHEGSLTMEPDTTHADNDRHAPAAVRGQYRASVDAYKRALELSRVTAESTTGRSWLAQ